MIVISGVLVVLALVLLIAGVVADSLTLIYLSIATSAVSFLSLVFGVRQRKDEALPGSSGAPSQAAASSGAGAGAPVSAARSGGSVALLERLEPSGGQAERSAPTTAPSLADTAVAGSAFHDGARPADHPAAGAVPVGGHGPESEAPEESEGDADRVGEAEEPAGEVEDVQPVAYEAVETGAAVGDEEYDDYEAYEEEASEGVVLVINGRPRYHVEGCRFVAGKDAEAIAVEDAREEGFTACGVCRPDEALAAAAELYDEEDLEDEELPEDEYDDDEDDDELLDEEDGYVEDEADDQADDQAVAPVGVPAEVAVVPGQTLTVVGAEPAETAELDDEGEYAEDEYGDEYDEDEDAPAAEYDDEGYEDDDEAYAESAQHDAATEAVPSDGLAGAAPPPPDVVTPARAEPVPEAPAAAAAAPAEPSALPARPVRARRLAAAAAAEPSQPTAGAEPVVAAADEATAPTGARPAGARRTRSSRPGATSRPASTRPARSTAPTAAPTPVPESVPAPPPRTSTRGRVVVIPDRGRYHRAECRYVRDSPDAVEITKNRATKQGYVPCGVCKP